MHELCYPCSLKKENSFLFAGAFYSSCCLASVLKTFSAYWSVLEFLCLLLYPYSNSYFISFNSQSGKMDYFFLSSWKCHLNSLTSFFVNLLPFFLYLFFYLNPITLLLILSAHSLILFWYFWSASFCSDSVFPFHYFEAFFILNLVSPSPNFLSFLPSTSPVSLNISWGLCDFSVIEMLILRFLLGWNGNLFCLPEWGNNPWA